jgi:hypothetical protein
MVSRKEEAGNVCSGSRKDVFDKFCYNVTTATSGLRFLVELLDREKIRIVTLFQLR